MLVLVTGLQGSVSSGDVPQSAPCMTRVWHARGCSGLGISQYRLAQATGLPQTRISEIVHGRRRVTPDTGLRLSRALGLSERYWINMQTDYDIETEHDLHEEELSFASGALISWTNGPTGRSSITGASAGPFAGRCQRLLGPHDLRRSGFPGWHGQMAFSASGLVTTRPRAPTSCRSPNISMRMDWSRPPTWTGSKPADRIKSATRPPATSSSAA
jgi:antitoxin HigA-1